MRRKQNNQHIPMARLLGRAGKRMPFNPTYMVCDGEKEVEEDGKMVMKPCEGIIFDSKTVYNVFYVPQIIAQKDGGAYEKRPYEVFQCMSCGKVFWPNDWTALAKKVYEDKSTGEKPKEKSNIVVLDEFKRNDEPDSDTPETQET